MQTPAGLEVLTGGGHPDFLDLPWSEPLASWKHHRLVDVARGVSRHVVSFVDYEGTVYALKETEQHTAVREYQLLRDLDARHLPVVEAVGVVAGRGMTDTGDDLDSVLITRHLSFALPYRYLFGRRDISDLRNRLLDAMALLLVRLHLNDFFWGDCSLSNTLFRRDAGALAAYLVDAETGRFQPSLSAGARAHDISIATENVGGELLDLQAAGRLSAELDPMELADDLARRYSRLWDELNQPEVISIDRRHRVAARVAKLNELGFDVAELAITATPDGERLSVVPRVVELGHHRRRLQQLTGLDVGENQARRLLNDIDQFGATLPPLHGRKAPEAFVAYQWLNEVFAPAIAAIPEEFGSHLDEAELFHQLLEHRWFLSESEGRDVGMAGAIDSYVRVVLSRIRAEETLFPDGGVATNELNRSIASSQSADLSTSGP